MQKKDHVLRLILTFLCAAAIASFGIFPEKASADLFYAVSNYSTGSAGTLIKDSGDFKVKANQVNNLGRDAWGFSFRDAGANQRAMIREYRYGPNDTVYIWDPANWKAPIVNESCFGTNLHAVTSHGPYLFAVTYEGYFNENSNQDSGEIVRLDTANGYKVDKRWQYKTFTNSLGAVCSPHGEAVAVYNGKVYALFAISYNGVSRYEESELIEFEMDLTPTGRKAKVGKNALRMAEYNGKAYVAAIGGYQGPMTSGNIYEVDLETMTSRKLIDCSDSMQDPSRPATVSGYGITIAKDGTAYIMAGSYHGAADSRMGGNDNYAGFNGRIFVTTAEALSKMGDPGEVAASYYNAGFSWDLVFDEKDSTLWCMVGKALEARDKSGALVRRFEPAELGDNIYSIAVMDDLKNFDSDDGGDNDGGHGGTSDGGGGGGCDSGAGCGFAAAMLIFLCRTRLKRTQRQR
ncbi:MAG: hypothetical protein RRY12_03820 [Cloacibacillus sp.]